MYRLGRRQIRHNGTTYTYILSPSLPPVTWAAWKKCVPHILIARIHCCCPSPGQFYINIKTIDNFISLWVLSLPSVLPAHTQARFGDSELARKCFVSMFWGNNVDHVDHVGLRKKYFNILRSRRARSDEGCWLPALQTDELTNPLTSIRGSMPCKTETELELAAVCKRSRWWPDTTTIHIRVSSSLSLGHQ